MSLKVIINSSNINMVSLSIIDFINGILYNSPKDKYDLYSLGLNTILLWNKNDWPLRKDAKPIYDKLYNAKILHYDNVSAYNFNAVKGTGVIFPSWLYHWVPAATDTRISISWNIILRGHYGGHRYLQNANI